MLIYFRIKEDVDLFTVCDYKKLIKLILDHFVSECSKYYCAINFAKPYYNPTLKEGCIEYSFENYDDTKVIISDVEFPDGNDMLTVTFF